MAYAKQDNDGLWRVYDTDCSGVISGPYSTQAEAEAVAKNLND